MDLTADGVPDETETSDRVDIVRVAAQRLAVATSSVTPCPPVRDLLGTDVEKAYAVQRIFVQRAMQEGRRVVGRKVGLTSVAVQRQLGVDQPDYGYLFDDMVVADGGVAPMGRLLQPRIEAEIAFVLSADIEGGVDEDSVRRAIGTAVAAFEIVDSRIQAWDIKLVDTVADNASCGLFVLGAANVPLAGIDLPEVQMTMTDGSGQVVSSGSGRDCLGDPVRAATWVAGMAADQGDPLRAGDIILAGALGPMVAATAGASYQASLSGLGTVRVSFG